MASVTFREVCKTYPDGTVAVESLDLEIADGEFVVLVGPSGCGKTTSLRMVAGLEDVSTGTLRIGDETVTDLDPRRRDVAMVFQNYALYPHMTTYQNLAFPLQSRKVPRAEIDQRVRRAAGLLGLEDQLRRRPKSLSGGQRQRVAMGRAIVREPQVFLMDEPLSNLDAQLRVQMRAEIARLQAELRVTTIYVTHDQVEAMTMGDRIAVMRKGELQQFGPPQVLYDHPANLFVATFIGSPSMNLLRAEVEVQDGNVSLSLRDRRFTLPPAERGDWEHLRRYDGRSVAIGVRPEDAGECGEDGNDGELVIRGNVRLVELLGHEQLVHLDVEADRVYTEAVMEIARDVDVSVAQTLEREVEEHVAGFTARFDGRSSAREGARQHVSFDPQHLKFFDLDSGAALVRT